MKGTGWFLTIAVAACLLGMVAGDQSSGIWRRVYNDLEERDNKLSRRRRCR